MEQKRKIGGVIIMHPGQNNYGTSLQGYATIKIFKKMGYPIRIIRYIKKRSLGEVIRTAPGLIRSGAVNVLFNKLSQKWYKRIHPEYARLVYFRTAAVNRFKDYYFEPLCDYYRGYAELCKGSKNYDVIFVGSDQVWGPLSLYARFYNLTFVDKSVPQFSYSSSFGKSNILEWQRKGVAEFLNKMDAIGVREIRGKEIVKELTGRDAEVVADPTLLLSKSDWEESIASSKASINEPYILSYILGPRTDIREAITEFGKSVGLKIVSFRHMDMYEPADQDFGDIPIYNADCLDFVRLLSNAEYVCTDSFHCTVFSILFHKKFTTFYRLDPSDKNSSHSRIDSLLLITGLSDRLFHGNLAKEIIEDIDYSLVDSKISKLRNDSLSFLRNCLELRK